MTETVYAEIRAKEKTIRKLEIQLGKRDSLIGQQKKEINNLAVELRKLASEIEPIKESLNNLTAERGKWLRKLKRAGFKGIK